MNQPCLSCGSAGNGEPGASPAWTVCRLCGRAWVPDLGPELPAYPELTWWLVLDPSDGGLGWWHLYECETASKVMIEIASSGSRRVVLDLIQEMLDLIGERRQAGQAQGIGG